MFNPRISMLRSAALTDKKITGEEAKGMTAVADYGVANKNQAAQTFQQLLATDAVEPEARAEFQRFLSGAKPGAISGNVIAHHPGQRGTLDDNNVFITQPSGTQSVDSGLRPYTRSYASIKSGPLRHAQGSKMPASQALTASEAAIISSQTPGQALDRAAQTFRSRAGGFDQLSRTNDFYNPNAQHWEGKCHAWTWASLSDQLNTMVDVPGPEGKKGLWIAGQWLSRADLGNWLMAVADKISLNTRNEIFDSRVTAMDTLAAINTYLVPGGGGVIGDVHLDSAHGGGREVWNQPFSRATQTVSPVEGAPAQGILSLAAREGVRGAGVSLIAIQAPYGQEVGDHYEGPPHTTTRHWNIYAVRDNQGKVVAAYTADSKKLDGIENLPTRSCQELVEYFWKPDLSAVDAALTGRAHPVVDNDIHGSKFRFIVGTVLPRGVPATLREAFEAEVFGSNTHYSPQAAAQLAAQYPLVANAYSPEQWRRNFAARGLSAQQFGAAWPSGLV
jgi:hypothetical protein